MSGSARHIGIPPSTFVYERRSSSLSDPVPAQTSGFVLLRWEKPQEYTHFLLYSVGTDQHMSSNYTWVVDGTSLPISGPARVGSIDNPYVFPEPLMVSGNIKLYIENANLVSFPNTGTNPEDEFPYECVICGRYV